MAKSKFTAYELYALLFQQLERMNDEDISNEDLQKEIMRGESIVAVADRIIDLAKTEVAMEGLRIKGAISTDKMEGYPQKKLAQVSFFDGGGND